MRRFHHSLLCLVPLVFASIPLLVAACGGASTQPSQPVTSTSASVAPAASSTPLAIAVPPEPPMPVLRTGTLQPIEHAGVITPSATWQGLAGKDPIIAAELPAEALAGIGMWNAGRVVVTLPEGQKWGVGFVSARSERPMLWLVSASNTLQPVTVDLFTPAEGGEPGHHFQVRVDPGAATKQADLGERWAGALGEYFALTGMRNAGAFGGFARQRLAEVYAGKTPGAGPIAGDLRGDRISSPELSFLMETTTGAASIQETLQNDRSLFLAAGNQKPTIALTELKAPPMAVHPFQEMLGALGRKPPVEALATAIPAEFYYVRFADLPSLFRLVDQADTWGTPIATALSRRGEDRRLSARYEAQLGISRGPLSRTLGPEAIGSVAVTGSDPYLREGSDVTLVFSVKSRPLFEAGMASALTAHTPAHGKPNLETTTHDGRTIRIAKSADGQVRQHRASVGDLEIVSNSLVALTRVLDTIAGKHARLSDEPDFQYMLARDAETLADVLGFMGDRFVAEVIGPRQKILEARRQMALAELSAPGFAALLHGHIKGQSPASTDELVKSGLLRKQELQHRGGEAIAFQPGTAARSSWGTPESLTPIIELPEPKLVTEAERQAYERFARGYQQNWSTFIDPAMVRLGFGPGKGEEKSALVADLRILPLIDASEYRDLAEIVGSAAVKVGQPENGLRVVLALGQEARIRKEMGGLARSFVGRDFAFDWLGDWAMIGAADRASLAVAVAAVERSLPQRPRTQAEWEYRMRVDEIAEIARLPLYGALGVKSAAGATLALAAARKMAEDVAPGQVSWEKHAEHRGVSIVRIAFIDREAKLEDEIQLLYALAGGALLFSAKEDLLRKLLDEQLDGQGPAASVLGKPGKPGDPQLVLDLAGAARGPLWTVLSWFAQMEALGAQAQSRFNAGILLRGAPEVANRPESWQALALAYFGAVPVPPDGGSYGLTPQGVRDPARGTEHAPIWPAIPVPGSPVDRLLGNVYRFRSEMSFDDEGRTRQGAAMQSLHVRLGLGLRSE